MSKYRSIARWPKGAGINLGNALNESDDTHSTRERAEAICHRLELEGFGGGRRIFPISTRVEEIPDEIEDTPELLKRRIEARNRAREAIFEIERTLPPDHDVRRAFYRARIALADAWQMLENEAG